MLKISSKTARANIFVVAIIISLISSVGINSPAKADREILFPVLGMARFSDDFNSLRGTEKHNAIDIFAVKHIPLLAAVDGTVNYVAFPRPSYGYMVQITDSEGYQYNYIHINNDTPGTDDGVGGEMNAYAADMKRGNKVVRGQFIGWLGDSGNAESTAPHLHFEIYAPDGTAINPYNSLLNALHKFNLDRYDYPSLAGETLPFDKFTGGVNIAYGNILAGAPKEVIVGAGVGGGPHVKIYNNDMSLTDKVFFAYDKKFTGGADVAAGDVIGTMTDEIVTAAGETGGSHVRIVKYDNKITQGSKFVFLNSFFAYDKFYGGVRVSVGNRIQNTSKDEIMTIPKNQGLPHVKLFDGSGNYLNGKMFFEDWWVGFYDIAAGHGASKATAGLNRRITVRAGY